MTKFNKVNFPNTNSLFEPKYLKDVIEFHKNNLIFSKRPVTTFLIEELSALFDINISASFVLINYFFLFFSGILLYHLSKLIINNTVNSIFNLIVYYTSFSIFFIFFPPIYSYDEPVHYSLLLGSLIYFFQKKWLPFSILFFGSLITRESSLIFSVGLISYIYIENKTNYESIKKSLYILIPIFIYFLYRFVFFKIPNNFTNEISMRTWGLVNNFQNKQFCIETLISYFNVVFFPCYFIYSFYKRSKSIQWNKNLITSFFVLVNINSFLVICGMNARESRLFFLPLLLISPYFYCVILEIKYLFSIISFKKLKHVFYLITITFISYYISKILYIPTINCDKYTLFNEYTFVTLSLFFIYIVRNQLVIKDKQNDRLINHIERR